MRRQEFHAGLRRDTRAAWSDVWARYKSGELTLAEAYELYSFRGVLAAAGQHLDKIRVKAMPEMFIVYCLGPVLTPRLLCELVASGLAWLRDCRALQLWYYGSCGRKGVTSPARLMDIRATKEHLPDLYRGEHACRKLQQLFDGLAALRGSKEAVLELFRFRVLAVLELQPGQTPADLAFWATSIVETVAISAGRARGDALNTQRLAAPNGTPFTHHIGLRMRGAWGRVCCVGGGGGSRCGVGTFCFSLL